MSGPSKQAVRWQKSTGGGASGSEASSPSKPARDPNWVPHPVRRRIVTIGTIPTKVWGKVPPRTDCWRSVSDALTFVRPDDMVALGIAAPGSASVAITTNTTFSALAPGSDAAAASSLSTTAPVSASSVTAFSAAPLVPGDDRSPRVSVTGTVRAHSPPSPTHARAMKWASRPRLGGPIAAQLGPIASVFDARATIGSAAAERALHLARAPTLRVGPERGGGKGGPLSVPRLDLEPVLARASALALADWSSPYATTVGLGRGAAGDGRAAGATVDRSILPLVTAPNRLQSLAEREREADRGEARWRERVRDEPHLPEPLDVDALFPVQTSLLLAEGASGPRRPPSGSQTLRGSAGHHHRLLRAGRDGLGEG